MNTASVKLVLNGAKQTQALLKKYKQDQERKDFDAIDALRRSQLTDAERDERFLQVQAFRFIQHRLHPQPRCAKSSQGAIHRTVRR